MKTVPCVRAENLTEQQIRELRILDNKLNESDWDMDKLKLDLDDLDFSDFENLNFDLLDEEDTPNASERMGIGLNETISVVIDCIDDSEAERIYNELKEGGYDCRISTL